MLFWATVLDCKNMKERSDYHRSQESGSFWSGERVWNSPEKEPFRILARFYFLTKVK